MNKRVPAGDSSCLALPKPGHTKQKRSRKNYGKHDLKTKDCAICGKPFLAYLPKSKFCSQRCYQDDRNARERKHPRPTGPRECVVCRTPFTPRVNHPKQKYCSKACKHRSRNNGRKGGQKSKRMERQCAKCNKSFIAKAYFVKMGAARFCGTECWYSFLSAKKLAERARKPGRIRGTSSRGRNWDKISKWVIECKFGRICQGMCAKPECSNVIRFSCDHIVPYHLISTFEGKDPNAEVNLTALCESCHMKKTLAERKLFAGDVVGFMADARRIFRDMGPIKAALEYAGLAVPRFGISAEQFIASTEQS